MKRICAALLGGALLLGVSPALCAENPEGAKLAVSTDAKPQPTPQQRMDRRYPQPVLVGDLIGLPLLDYDDRTIGYVRSVVRTPDGRNLLIVTRGGWPIGWFNWRARLVPVPIEAVAILGRQIDLLDITREQLATESTWSNSDGVPIPPGEKIRIGIERR
jgi:hypothetical protein